MERRTTKPPLSVAVSILSLLAVTLILNLILSVYVWAPAASLPRGLVPLAEILVLVWAAVLTVVLVGRRRPRRLLIGVIGSLYGILLCFSITEAFFQFYFARPFLPRSDIPMVRGALLLLFGDIGRTADVLTPITVALILIVGAALGSGLFAGATAAIRHLRLPVVAMAVLTAVAIPVMVVAGLPRSLAATTVSWMGRSGAEFVRVSVPITTDDEAEGREGIPGDEVVEYRLPGLLDRDIYMFAVEAYGYTSVSRPELADQIDPYRNRLESALNARGYEVVSSYLRSPVAGGYSWLAEATLLTGQWIDSQEKFLELYDAGLPSLTGTLHDAGYYTLTVRPGTIHGAWPEGWDFYRFEEDITSFEKEFNFVGPWFSYVPVPDQYALWTGDRRIRELVAADGAAADRPLLVYYQLVSSHTPFNRIPPIIENWNQLGNGEIYNERAAEIQRFNNTWTGGSELDEGYVASTIYVLEVITDYVSRIMDPDRNPILIIFGDHQPQPPIRTPDAVKSVVIHVAARDPELLEAFSERGFEPGMKSSQEPPHLPMDKFFPMFVEIAAAESGR